MLRLRPLVPCLALGALGALSPFAGAQTSPAEPAVPTAAPATPAPSTDIELDSAAFAGLEARALGPAVMSGRIAAIDASPGPPATVWIGAASGGVWKSADGGTTFQPVFDQHTQSIGALSVDRRDPKTVWVGTGESWTRNSVSVGDGVYKTTDGGDSWQRLGLEQTERIARIALHPRDGNTAWVCATGHLWDDHPERGVYKTADGGKSWKKTLFVDDKTGCSDLAVDPQDPRILFAGLWQFRRTPWSFHSGGPGSGLWKSTDGGETWRELTRGLPDGDKGRIAVAPAPSRPSVVYALVEAAETALYRSDDVGESWVKINTSFNLQVRPFYFAHLVVDPADHDTVYKPGLTLTASRDGGKSFNSPFSGAFGGGVHSDHHALWINPQNPRQLILGTDGGAYRSEDGGQRWSHLRSLPVSQFYRVSVDDAWPYNVYGGLQDNGSWQGPSRSIGGVENRDWDNVGIGDGFYTFRDPADADYVYSEYQGGKLSRLRLSTRELRDIQPLPRQGEPDYRFNWNTPVHLSPNEPGTLYIGSQFLLRSRDRGESWERISPDLTTNDPKKQQQRRSGGLTIDNSTAENHTTIYAIAESPRNGRVIWAGTDDGNLQVTRDGGATWQNVAGAVAAAGLPRGTWVSSIEASRRDEATAYATFDGHHTGDLRPWVFKTADFGRTWQPLAGETMEGYAHIVREDLENPDLLFVGTETGLFLSVDGGARWARFTGNFPRVAVRDVVVHPRDGDLVIATHGRGIYVLDDLTPLRRLTREVLQADAFLFGARPAVMVAPATAQTFGGDDEFVGGNPEEAAAITYYLKKRHLFGDLKAEIYDAGGKLISTIPGGKRRGLNRIQWPMRLRAPKIPAANSLVQQPFSFLGPRVPAGTYTVKLIQGDKTHTGQVELVPDPRSGHSAEDRALQQKTALALYGQLEHLTYLAEAVVAGRDQAGQRRQGLKESDALSRQLADLARDLEAFRATLVATSEGGWLAGEEQLREKLGHLYGAVNGYDGRPTRSQLDRMAVLGGQLDSAAARFQALLDGDVARVNRPLIARKLEPLRVPTREEWESTRKD